MLLGPREPNPLLQRQGHVYPLAQIWRAYAVKQKTGRVPTRAEMQDIDPVLDTDVAWLEAMIEEYRAQIEPERPAIE